MCIILSFYKSFQIYNNRLCILISSSKQHMGAGARFTVFKYRGQSLQYLSFAEVDLKDDTHLAISEFPAEGIVGKNFPSLPGFCRVGGAFFMVAGVSDETKLIWSARPPPPPIPGGSFPMTWTRCDTAMDSGRLSPMVVPLHDGKIFICGGTAVPKCWVEIYDPDEGMFDHRDLPDHILNPFPSSCFLWAHQSIMLYYHRLNQEEQDFHPSLILYNVGRNTWEIFADNLPEPPELYDLENRNLIYVGGNILFIIDRASRWFVYDLSTKEEVGKVDVMVEDERVMHAFYLGNNDIKDTSWIFYIFMSNVKHECGSSDLRYAKVEVVQGNDGDYIARVQMSGLLRVGDYTSLHIIADEASHKRTVEKEKRVRACCGWH